MLLCYVMFKYCTIMLSVDLRYCQSTRFLYVVGTNLCFSFGGDNLVCAMPIYHAWSAFYIISTIQVLHFFLCSPLGKITSSCVLQFVNHLPQPYSEDYSHVDARSSTDSCLAEPKLWNCLILKPRL